MSRLHDMVEEQRGGRAEVFWRERSIHFEITKPSEHPLELMKVS